MRPPTVRKPSIKVPKSVSTTPPDPAPINPLFGLDPSAAGQFPTDAPHPLANPSAPTTAPAPDTGGSSFSSIDGSMGGTRLSQTIAQLGLKPIDSSLVSGNSLFDQGMNTLFRSHMNDTLDDAANKIEALSANKSQFGSIRMNSETASFALKQINDIYGSETIPQRTASPEELALMAQINEVAPQRKMVGFGDLPDAYRNFALAYGLASQLRGGTFIDGLRMLNSGVGMKQQEADLEYQRQADVAKTRREAAAQSLDFASKVADANFQQKGYFERDKRSALNAVARELATLDRQTAVEATKFLNGAGKDLFTFIAKGDSDRMKPLADMLYEITGGRIDATKLVLDKTSTEKLTDSKATGQEFKNQINQHTIDMFGITDARAAEKFKKEMEGLDLSNQAKITKNAQELIKLKWLPSEKKLQYHLLGVKADALQKSAQAALIRANKAGSGGGSSDTLKTLRALSASGSSLINGLLKKVDDATGDLTKIDNELQDIVELEGKSATANDKRFLDNAKAVKHYNDVLQKRQAKERERNAIQADLDAQQRLIEKAQSGMQQMMGGSK